MMRIQLKTISRETFITKMLEAFLDKDIRLLFAHRNALFPTFSVDTNFINNKKVILFGFVCNNAMKNNKKCFPSSTQIL